MPRLKSALCPEGVEEISVEVEEITKAAPTNPRNKKKKKSRTGFVEENI